MRTRRSSRRTPPPRTPRCPSGARRGSTVRDRGRQFHPGRQPDQQPGHPPSRAVDRVQHGQHQQHVDLSVVERAAQRFEPDADGCPQHRDTSTGCELVIHRQQTLADAHHAVQRGDDAQLPRERDEAERQQVQRVEDDGRKRRIGERQREIRRLVGVDVVVERARAHPARLRRRRRRAGRRSSRRWAPGRSTPSARRC